MQTFPLTTQMMLMQSNNNHHSNTTISDKTVLGMYLALILVTLIINLIIAVRLYFTGYNNFFKDYIYELQGSAIVFLFIVIFIILGHFIGTLL